MTNYLIYPSFVDGEGFPSEVNESIIESPEAQVELDTKLDKTEAALTYATPAQVDPMVTAAIAATPTVTNAAAAAVNGALTTAGVLSGASTVRDDITDITFTIVDSSGNRSWLEIAPSGGPTPESATAIASAITTPVNAIVSSQLAAQPIPSSIPSSAPAVFSVVASDDQRSWLEVAEDGGPTANAMGMIQSRLIITPAPNQYSDVGYGGKLIKAVSGPSITLYGDSMTAADWATVLAALTGRTVKRRGVGGETSQGIAARANAMPYMMLPVGGSIPASGAVNIALTSSGGGNSWPLLQGSGTSTGYMDGVLAGIPGRVTLVKGVTALPYHGSDDTYVFTRTASGSSVTVTRPMPFYYDDGELNREDITVIWAGRNNFAEDNGDRAFRDIKAITKYLNTLDKRFLILSVHNGTGEGVGTTNYLPITGLNARLLAEYGRRFVDHRRYLIDYGLSDLGITPTSQDAADVAADTVPVSLRTDTIHQTVDARGITAAQVNLRLREMGWV